MNIYKPAILLASFSGKSMRSFFSVIILWFMLMLILNYTFHTLFLNAQKILAFDFNLTYWYFTDANEWGWLFLHGFLSSILTGMYAIFSDIQEKKRIYQTQPIKAYRDRT